MMSFGSVRVLLEVAASDVAMAAMVAESDMARGMRLISSAVESLGGAAQLLLEQQQRESENMIRLPQGADIDSPEQYARMREMVDRYSNLHPALREDREEEDEQDDDRSAGDQADREDSEGEGEAGTGQEESQE